MRRAVYAGTFDPLTKGHEWMIASGAYLFDELVVAIANNPNKKCMFSLEERKEMISEHCKFLKFKNVSVEVIENEFLVDFAKSHGCLYMLRGIRNGNDFIYEHSMLNINREFNPHVQTIFIMPPIELAEVSSSMVKGLVGFKDWNKRVLNYISPFVYEKLKNK